MGVRPCGEKDFLSAPGWYTDYKEWYGHIYCINQTDKDPFYVQNTGDNYVKTLSRVEFHLLARRCNQSEQTKYGTGVTCASDSDIDAWTDGKALNTLTFDKKVNSRPVNR